jgi:hypothetical protein
LLQPVSPLWRFDGSLTWGKQVLGNERGGITQAIVSSRGPGAAYQMPGGLRLVTSSTSVRLAQTSVESNGSRTVGWLSALRHIHDQYCRRIEGVSMEEHAHSVASISESTATTHNTYHTERCYRPLGLAAMYISVERSNVQIGLARVLRC